MRIAVILLTCTIAIIAGCKGHCVTVGGGYGDYEGEITYCFDAKKSKDLKKPVLEKEDGEKALIVDESDARSINEKIKAAKEEIGLKAVKLPAEDPLAELIYLLEEE
jgi:hypothetical protein